MPITVVRTFEYHADPASQLLNAWSTDYVTLRQLVSCLQSAGLLREASFILDLVQPPRSPTPEQTPAAVGQDSQDDVQIPYTELSRWTKNFNDMPVQSGGSLLGQGGYADVFKGP